MFHHKIIRLLAFVVVITAFPFLFSFVFRTQVEKNNKHTRMHTQMLFFLEFLAMEDKFINFYVLKYERLNIWRTQRVQHQYFSNA